jgi:serine/threonine-protein kinase
MVVHDDLVQRFLREARLAIKIRSEHCVRVLDVGTLENGVPYMVMEYLEGEDLAAIVDRRQTVPIAAAIDWVLQAAEALAEAHALGIVHRDLKPANLFLTRRADGTPCVKVLDFGISKQTASGADAGVTKTQAVLGSPRYMSPEQMRSTKDVDVRTDVWALGAVVHELIAGQPPFDAETMTALCAAILQDPPRPIRLTRPDVPPQLEAAIVGALEKDRDLRFPNIAQLAAALAPFGSPAAGASAERIARILGVAATPATSTTPLASLPRPGSQPPALSSGSALFERAGPAWGPTHLAATTGQSGSIASEVGRKSSGGPLFLAVAGGLLVAVAAAVALVAWTHRPPAPRATPAAPAAIAPTAAPGTTAVVGSELPPLPPSAAAPASSATAEGAASANAAGTSAGSAGSAAPSAARGPAGAPRRPPVTRERAPEQPAGGAPPAKTPPANTNPFGDDRKG